MTVLSSRMLTNFTVKRKKATLLMNDQWTVKKLFEEITRVETEYKLFEKQIDGVYVWKLIRFYLFAELSKKLNLREALNPNQGQTTNRYMWLLKHFINGTFNGPLTGKNDSEILLFSHPRKVVTEDDKLTDIYSEYLEDKWKEEGTNYLVIEKPYNGVFLRKASPLLRHNETLSLFTLGNYFRPKKDMNLSIHGLDTIGGIPIETIEALSKENISRAIHTFKREYHYYTKVLTKHKPKKIYMVVAYFRHALVAAADDLGIETIEIQHGEISPFNIGYNYPGHKKIPYFPSRLILWGEFWYNPSRIPLNAENITYDGFPYLDKEIKTYKDITQDKSRVLFISQRKIGKLLVDVAVEFAETHREYKVVYRLHPSEVEDWESLYPKLYASSIETGNITVETGKMNPLHKSLAMSKFVVGVNSTALIESLTLNCKLILVDLPGVEYFQGLIDQKLVKKVENAETLAKILKDDTEDIIIDRNYFFKEYTA